MANILSIGAAVQDVFLRDSAGFEPVIDKETGEPFLKLGVDGKADVHQIEFSTGGGATNASVTFARQGLGAIFMGTIGHDPAGKAVLEMLDAENVDTSGVTYSEKYNTGYSVLLVAPDGSRTILTYRGASTYYDASNFDLHTVEPWIDWIYLSSMAGNMEALDKIVSHAKERKVKVFINPGKGELAKLDKLKALLDDVEILSVNKEEAQQIVEGETLEELIRHMLNIVPVAIISDGPNGVIASDGKTIVRAGMYEDVPVIDRTGAGDAFGSGFLSQWVQGKSLKESIIFASANSTSVVQEIGAKTGILGQHVNLHEMPLNEESL